jgi:hypothetical protein
MPGSEDVKCRHYYYLQLNPKRFKTLFCFERYSCLPVLILSLALPKGTIICCLLSDAAQIQLWLTVKKNVIAL